MSPNSQQLDFPAISSTSLSKFIGKPGTYLLKETNLSEEMIQKKHPNQIVVIRTEYLPNGVVLGHNEEVYDSGLKTALMV